MPRPSRLSRRVFLLVAALVMACGVLVHLPALVIFRTDYLQHRLIDAYMATIALRAGGTLTAAQQAMLLEQAHLLGIELQADGVELRLGAAAPVERDILLNREPPGQRLLRTVQALFDNRQGWLRVSGIPSGEQDVWIAVTLDAAALRRAVRHHAIEALALSVAISLVTAGLVQLGLIRLLLRPVERLTAQLAAFHADPYHTPPPEPTLRADEIGELQRSLAAMETEVQTALKRETRLAALGGAVARIHHDLKSILSTVSFASARLADAADPRNPPSEGDRVVLRVLRAADGSKGAKLAARPPLPADLVAEGKGLRPPQRLRKAADPVLTAVESALANTEGPGLARVVVDDAAVLAELRAAFPDLGERIESLRTTLQNIENDRTADLRYELRTIARLLAQPTGPSPRVDSHAPPA
ncbi:MAG: hypothetical protein ABTR27_14250 [Candidatus Competibacter phosphatis]